MSASCFLYLVFVSYGSPRKFFIAKAIGELPEANRIASTRCLRLSALYAQGSESSFSDFGSLQLFFKKECFYLLRRRSPSGLSGADELSAGLRKKTLELKLPSFYSMLEKQ